jgi:hypothetical protein
VCLRRGGSASSTWWHSKRVITRDHLYCVLGRVEACSEQEAERIRHRDGRRHTQAFSRVANQRKQPQQPTAAGRDT